MDISKALIVVGIILIVVIGFNVVIYFSARGKHSINEIDILQRATKKIRNPWMMKTPCLVNCLNL